jgi:hypothetical protein
MDVIGDIHAPAALPPEDMKNYFNVSCMEKCLADVGIKGEGAVFGSF